MVVVLKVDMQKREAIVESYDDAGQKLETIENVRQLTFENFSDANNIMPAPNFMIAGTALTHSETGEIKLQRFMNKDNHKFAQLKANSGGKVRTHPNDNGNRLFGDTHEEVAHHTEDNSPGVFGFMDDIVIRQQPRGR